MTPQMAHKALHGVPFVPHTPAPVPTQVPETIKKTGTYKGKSNVLGHGGRSSQLRDALQAKGLPESEIGGIIGKEARRTQSAPGQKNYHGKRA